MLDSLKAVGDVGRQFGAPYISVFVLLSLLFCFRCKFILVFVPFVSYHIAPQSFVPKSHLHDSSSVPRHQLRSSLFYE